jgi:aspartate/methionine/tyrosine aminotransferase
MSYERIHYLHWARQNLDTVKVDLTRSNLHGITREDIGFRGEEVELSKAVEKEPTEFQRLLAARYDLPLSQIRVTIGSTMALFAIFEAILEKGDEVLLETPNYEPLYANLNRRRVAIKSIDRSFDDGWDIRLEEVQRKISRNTKAIVLTNLHNPTGVPTNPDKLAALCQLARDHQAHVIVDEVYLDAALVPGLRPAVQCGPNAVSISSMSKSLGLGYLRAGWIATKDEALAAKLDTIVDDYLIGSLPMPSMSIAAMALRRVDALVAKARSIVEANLKILSGWISRHNSFGWVKPAGGTVCFVKLPPGVDDVKLSETLRTRHDTLVAPGHFFWKKGFIRIAYGCDADTLRTGLRNIQAAVDETGWNS